MYIDFITYNCNIVCPHCRQREKLQLKRPLDWMTVKLNQFQCNLYQLALINLPISLLFKQDYQIQLDYPRMSHNHDDERLYSQSYSNQNYQWRWAPLFLQTAGQFIQLKPSFCMAQSCLDYAFKATRSHSSEAIRIGSTYLYPGNVFHSKLCSNMNVSVLWASWKRQMRETHRENIGAFWERAVFHLCI